MPAKTPIAANALNQLQAWFAQRPNFALMGEFNAGKSTLLNLLLGRSVLPESITATKLPVIWLSYGTSPESLGLTRAGDLQRLDTATPEPGGWEDYLVVRMVIDAPILRLCDVIDTPGISDPRLESDAIAFLAEFIDFGVWCTAAGQAWRQSEKTAWKAFPAELRDASILALTRVDRMNGPADVDKVMKRLRKDTKALFRDIHPIASRVAMTAAADGKITNPDVWASSGAADLIAGIKASIKLVEAQFANRAAIPEPLEMALSQAAETAPVPQTEAAPDLPSGEDTVQISAVLAQARSTYAINPSKITFLAIIEQLRGTFTAQKVGNEPHAMVLARCLMVNDVQTENPSRVLEQVEREIEDFANGPWCSLA